MESKRKILIVEDDTALLTVLYDKFVAEGFNAIKAVNGKEGLKMSLKEHPDIVLLDILMPEMDGITMIRELRKDTWGKKATVILLTNVEPDTSIAKEMVESEPAYYFVKSDMEIEAVVKKVKELLNE